MKRYPGSQPRPMSAKFTAMQRRSILAKRDNDEAYRAAMAQMLAGETPAQIVLSCTDYTNCERTDQHTAH